MSNLLEARVAMSGVPNRWTCIWNGLNWLCKLTFGSNVFLQIKSIHKCNFTRRNKRQVSSAIRRLCSFLEQKSMTSDKMYLSPNKVEKYYKIRTKIPTEVATLLIIHSKVATLLEKPNYENASICIENDFPCPSNYLSRRKKPNWIEVPKREWVPSKL